MVNVGKDTVYMEHLEIHIFIYMSLDIHEFKYSQIASMSKTMDALKVHEFANNLFNPLQNEWTHGDRQSPSRTRGFKIQTNGNLRGKQFPSLHGPKHIPCFGYLKKTKPHTFWPNLSDPKKPKQPSISWSSLISKLCFPCFSFPPSFLFVQVALMESCPRLET